MAIQDTSGQDRIIQPTRKPMRWWVTGLIIIALVATVGLNFKSWFAAERSFERARIRTATVTRGDLTRELAVEGRIVASSYPTLYATAGGTIKLHVRSGDQVERDAVLAEIDSPELRNQLLQETSALASLESELTRKLIASRTKTLENKQDVDLKGLTLETARRELTRSKQLFDEGLINSSEYDAAQDQVKIAELEYRHAAEKAELDRSTQELETQNWQEQRDRQKLVVAEAQRKVDELVLRSPVAGMVGSLLVDPRDTVMANQAILTVIDLSAFEIEIQIPEFYADDVQIGLEAAIAYEGQTFAGRVSLVSPEVNNSVVVGRVVFDGEGPSGLRQNQRVSTRILLSTRTDVLKVRRGPFLEAGGGHTTYVVRGNLAYKMPIQTGSASLTEVEIVSGLNEGDEMVISDPGVFQGSETVYLR
ncbi:MAG: efflux RND transporter periplasmic adaptor subunit [Acidobacteria bacterium]|nr:efflux RND transporter periplasmic adaptor subunit [Acidobacteriota bacterium]